MKKKISIIKGRIINHLKGNIYKIINNKEFDIAEVYVSRIKKNAIKGWKLNKNQTSNYVVIFGKVKFVFFSKDKLLVKSLIASSDKRNFKIIKVPPNFWYAFKGLSNNESLILNCSDRIHNKEKSQNKPLSYLKFKWSKT
jgi:dTDP-4-dehydrorhamnose 3,5-epimerase